MLVQLRQVHLRQDFKLEAEDAKCAFSQKVKDVAEVVGVKNGN